jgi:hypothetical protein
MVHAIVDEHDVPEPEVALNGLPAGSLSQLGGAVGVRSRHRCRNIASRAVPDVRDRVDDVAEYFLERQTQGRNLGSHGGAASVFSLSTHRIALTPNCARHVSASQTA